MWKSLLHKIFPSEKLPRGRKRIAFFVSCLCLGACVLVYVGKVVPERIAFSKTDSLSYRFFFYKEHFSQEELKVGRYIIIPIYSDIIEECRPCTVVKQIGCDEGENLTATKEGYYYCNDNYLGHAKTHSKKGVQVENFKYNGIVAAGEFFAIGSCPDSYDSRYIGFLKKMDVEAVAIPIF